MTDYEKNINSGSCEKYLEWDEFNVTFRQMIIVPLNETAKKLGARIMLQKPSNIRILGALFVAERMTVKELSEAASISFANIAKPCFCGIPILIGRCFSFDVESVI